MKNKTWHVFLIVCMAGGLCVMIDNPRVEARGSGAVAGTAASGSSRTCFRETYGGVRNDCSTARSFVLPATYDNAGGMTIQVAARGVSGTSRQVRCRAWSVDSAGGSYRWSSELRTQLHTGATEYLKMPINAHGWGATYAYCSMDPGTVIRNFHY